MNTAQMFRFSRFANFSLSETSGHSLLTTQEINSIRIVYTTKQTALSPHLIGSLVVRRSLRPPKIFTTKAFKEQNRRRSGGSHHGARAGTMRRRWSPGLARRGVGPLGASGAPVAGGGAARPSRSPAAN